MDKVHTETEDYRKEVLADLTVSVRSNPDFYG